MQKTENWHFSDHQIWGWSVSELHRDMLGSSELYILVALEYVIIMIEYNHHIILYS